MRKKRMSYVPYRSLPNERIQISDAAVARLLVVGVIALAVAAIALGVALGRWLDDKDARILIHTAEKIATSTHTKLQSIGNVASEALQQKATLEDLETTLLALKSAIAQAKTSVDAIDVLAVYVVLDLANSSITVSNTSVSSGIDQLHLEVGTAVSKVSGPAYSVISSGVCDVTGDGNATTTMYEYRHFANEASGLDFYHYVFGAFSGVDTGTGALVIENCNPAIYEGDMGEITPLFEAQQDAFTGRFGAIQAGGGKLRFIPADDLANGQVVAATREWGHLVSFF